MQQNESKLLDQVIKHLETLGYEFFEKDFRLSGKNQLPARADIVVLDSKRKPFLIVEAKNNLPKNISKFHPAVDQAYRYAKLVNAPFFLVTDGEAFNWFEIREDTEKFELIQKPPHFKEAQEILPKSIQPLDTMDFLYGVIDLFRDSGLNSNAYTNVLFALLLAKISDETNSLEDRNLQYQVYSGETPDETKKRVSNLFQIAIKIQDFAVDLEIIDKLDSGLVQNIVRKIEHLRIKETNIIENLFEDLISVSKSNRSFYTPPILKDFITQIFSILSVSRTR